MNSKQNLLLFFVILAAATLANLIALKIASDQVTQKLNSQGGGTGSLLKLLGGGA